MANKFYVTTAIAYANAKPHLGHALEFVQADVLARYHNFLGHKTKFATGMDESGLKNYRAAEKAGKETMVFLDEIAESFKKLDELYDVVYTDFVRTTSQSHKVACQAIWKVVAAKGDIYKKSYEAIYCVGCEEFKTASDLVDGKCPLHPNLVIEKIEEENYFFKLSKYEKDLLEFYEKNPDFVAPKEKFNELKRFVEGGLNDISISRPKEKLPWGISVPDDPNQVMYVWFDALTNYISIIGYGQSGKEATFKEWWPADVHVIGKDIVRFHGAIWPAMLLSAGLELPKQLFVHGFLTAGGEKMSKTTGNVIDPVEFAQKYGAEAARAFLLSEIPALDDADVSWERFDAFYQGVLSNGIGNLLQRTLTLINKADLKLSPSRAELADEVKKQIDAYQFHEAMRAVWGKVAEANTLIDKEKPWELIEKDKDRAEEVLTKVYRQLEEIALALRILVPATGKRIEEQLKSLKPEALFPRK